MHNRIKELRKEAGLTQSELGKKLGVVKQTVCAYEKGINIPSIDILQQMSTIFDVPIDYLSGKTDKRDNKVYLKPDPIPLTPDEQKALDILRQADDKRQLLRMMEKYVALNDDGKDIILGKTVELLSNAATELKPTGTEGRLGK